MPDSTCRDVVFRAIFDVKSGWFVGKGMKMAGQYGNKRMTARNLEVIHVDKKNNQILLKGSIPGANNGIVYITK